MFGSRTTGFGVLSLVFAGVLAGFLNACGPQEKSEFCGPIANTGTGAASPYGLKSIALGGGNGRLANKFYWPTSSLNVKQVDVRVKRKGALNGVQLSLGIFDDIGDGTQPTSTAQFSHFITLNVDELLGTNISTTEFEWVSFNPGCFADLEKHSTLDPRLYWLVMSASYSSSDTNQIIWGGGTNSANPVAAFKEFNSAGWQLFDYPTDSGTQDFLFRFRCVDTSIPADALLTACP